jgi:hypothetical protein
MSRISESKEKLAAENRAAACAPKFSKVPQKADPSKPPENNKKDQKKPTVMIPLAQQERIYQRFLSGESMRSIAQTEGRNRRTIRKVVAVAEEDQKEFIKKTREIAVGLVVPALARVKQSIDNGNAEMAYRLLEDIGVIPSSRKGAKPTIAEDAPETDITQDVRAQQILVSRLNPKQRMVWEMFSMFMDKKEAYGELEPLQEKPAVVEI